MSSSSSSWIGLPSGSASSRSCRSLWVEEHLIPLSVFCRTPPAFSASSPLLSDPPDPLGPLLLVLLLQSALLGGVLLHALGDGLVVFADVVEEPAQPLFDGLVHLFPVADDRRARLLRREQRMTPGTSRRAAAAEALTIWQRHLFSLTSFSRDRFSMMSASASAPS